MRRLRQALTRLKLKSRVTVQVRTETELRAALHQPLPFWAELEANDAG